MKKAYTLITVLALLLSLSLPAAAQESEGAKIIAGLPHPDLKWSVPEVGKDVQRVQLDNGMILYMMEDNRLPLVNVSVLVRCGTAYVPLEQMAIPDMTTAVMRTGGTTHVSPDSLNALLESIGGTLETFTGYDNSSATLNVMSKDTELGIRLLADVLRNPAFPEDKIDLKKTDVKTDIKRRNDNPSGILSREFYHLIYGDFPRGRILEWQYAKPITRRELVDYHQRYFAPNNVMIGITGKFDSKMMVEMVKQYFGDWKKKAVAIPQIPQAPETPRPGVFIVEKDINQANIRFGHLGVNRDNPDRYAISVMNYILGGGSFTSRISSKVRSDEGLSYSVATRYQVDEVDQGVFFAYCFTKSNTTHKAMQLMLDEVKRIRQGEVSDEELKSAKDSYINSYVFEFTTPAQIVSQLMGLEFNQRPPDLLRDYIDNVRKVTKKDVLRVAQKYLRPESLTFVVVGNPKNFDLPLDDFGKVTSIELKEPVLD